MKIARHRGRKKAIVALARRLAVILHRIWIALSSSGPERPQQHEGPFSINAIGGNSSSTQRWSDVPRATMDEASSHVRLDLPTIGKAAVKIVPPHLRIP
jgi:hypothetical protein